MPANTTTPETTLRPSGQPIRRASNDSRCQGRGRQTALQRRNQLVEQHRALVRPLAVHYCRCTPEPLDDLIQAGLLGLIRAAELFQRQQGTPFEAFARPHIRGAILHHLRDSAPAVRLPRRQAELQEKLLRLERTSQADSGALSSRIQALGLDLDQAVLLLRQRRLNRPLTLIAEHENSMTALSDQDQERLEGWPDEALDAMAAGGCRGLLAGLRERERLVVEQVVLAGQSYRQLARRLNVSPMTVRRRLHRGLDQLRLQIAAPLQPLSRSASMHRGRSAAPAC